MKEDSEAVPRDKIRDAIETVRGFIMQTTAQAPTDEEIADALTRYFVLNEIREHIQMVRSDG